MKDKIEFSEFLEIEKKLEIKMGTIIDVQRMEGSDKMLKLSVNFGVGTEPLTVMTNIGNRPGLSGEGEAEGVLRGMQLPFITNLKPAKMMGIESHAMIMVAECEDGSVDGLSQFGYSPGAKLL